LTAAPSHSAWRAHFACPPFFARKRTTPDRPINVIVPFAAGGPTDAIARIYAEFISRDLGQTLVIENVAGAGGTIGSTRAARATPDGYTIQIGQAGTHVSSVGLYKNLKYNPITDYEHLGLLGDLPQVLIVKRDLPPITSRPSWIMSAPTRPSSTPAPPAPARRRIWAPRC
jgi:tripartite-type tricarboxylate transporter receptor subunit TctC